MIPPINLAPGFLRRTLLAAFLLALVLAAPLEGQEAEAPGAGEFIRYLDEPGAEQLQSAVVRYRRGDAVVDLVGAIHLADPGYFSALNAQLAQYEVVLYELVGGPWEARQQPAAASSDFSLEALLSGQGVAGRLLALQHQGEGIDYGQPHFVHADMDWDQFGERLAARGQDMTTLFLRAMEMARAGEGPAVLSDQDAVDALLQGLVSGLTTGSSARLKQSIAPLLGGSEELVDLLEGEDGTVIITERNLVVMEALRRELGRGRQSVGIFYGAGHFPDLERRLLAEGFRRETGAWLTAWDLAGPDTGGNLWMRLLGDPELARSLGAGLQELLQRVQSLAGGLDAGR